MMWADNHWILSNDKDKLMWIVNDIIEQLLDLDMESPRRSRCGGRVHIKMKMRER